MSEQQQQQDQQDGDSAPDAANDAEAGGSNTTLQQQHQMTPQEAAIIEIMKRGNAAQAIQVGSQPQRHAFWDTQPMPHATPEGVELPEGPISEGDLSTLRETPYNMPTGFEWCDLDIQDDAQRLELYNLLNQNYVEDDDALFRFDYSQDFLLWALTPPGWRTDFLLGVRSSKSKKLVAFISAIPASIRVKSTLEIDMVEINFLCVHKKLRSKRLAPVLIKEITRRVNHTNVWQAVYTAGVKLPVPVASARYHHRGLNPRKLLDVGFSRLPRGSTLARHLKQYKLPAETKTPNLRPMVKSDVEAVHELLTGYLSSKFQLHVNFSVEDVAHWLLPREGVIDSYVVTKKDLTTITDFISFYHLPSSILNRNDKLRAAYSYYNIANKHDWVDLMRDALILARNKDCDVFNALDLMENKEFLEDLKFGLGDGFLQYYLYNWSIGGGGIAMEPNEIGIVLL